jgi:hypothetical protein
LEQAAIISLSGICQLLLVVVKCAFFELWIKFLSIFLDEFLS